MLKKLNFLEQFDYIILILLSFTINFYYSSIGVLPQDTFAYYDSAYRILNGSAPFRDYWTVSGPFIDYTQAFLFYIFNVSWKTYILNGSIINSIITVFFYHTLKSFSQKYILNLFYAICFSILANPSMGVPFTDHYSTFLSLMGIFSFLLAIKKKNKLFWFFVPIFLFLAFFSKQSPAAYLLLPILTGSLIYIYFYKNINFIKYFFLGTLCCVILLCFFFYLNKIDINQFFNQYILFPQTIAQDRLQNYKFNFDNLFFQFKFIYLFLIPLIAIALTQAKRKKLKNEKEIFIMNIIFILTSGLLIFHQIITKNFIFIFFLIPMLGSLLHLNFLNVKKYRVIISFFIISLTLFSTIKYHYRFNENRKMLNLEKVDLKLAVDSTLLHSSLKGLKWLTREYPNNPSNEIRIIKESMMIIKKDKSKKMLLSGYLFFSSILDEDLNNPSRWPSLGDASNPNLENEYFKFYEKFIKGLIKSKKIETLYSTKDNHDDVFVKIFDKKCLKTKVINDFLTKHDIRDCKI